MQLRAVDADDPAAKRKPQPAAALGAAPGLVDAVKRLGDVRKLLGAHAPSVVGHAEHGRAVFILEGDAHRPARAAGTDGVLGKIDDQALEQRPAPGRR